MKTATQAKSFSKGDQTRQRIIEKSAQVFNQRGFAGASISELMEATGLEKGGIYRHFESKEELAAAAFDYAWAAAYALRQRGLDEAESALDKLLLFVRNFAGERPNVVRGGCPLLNTAVDSDDGNPLLRCKARAALAQWREQIADLVRSGQQNHELRKEIDPESVAVVLISTLEGAIMVSGLEKNRQPLHVAGEHLTEYLLGLQALPSNTASSGLTRRASRVKPSDGAALSHLVRKRNRPASNRP